MKKTIGILLVTMLATAGNDLFAQIYLGGRFGGMYRGRIYRQRPPIKQQNPNLPKFEPTVNISVGYGFPNLDKYELPAMYNYYKGTYTQSGPVTGAIDYQFSRYMSIGALVTHGKVSVPYYDYNNSATPAVNGSLENWSFMLNLVRYMPVNSTKVSPYFRTAIGVNSWTQNFSDASGNKINLNGNPSDLAYQVGFGAKFNMSKNAGIFIEAGYGKYILHGGLALKF